MSKQDKWYKLDNAAKIFPPTTTFYDAKIFRFSILLKEEVKEDSLNAALQETIQDFPIYKSILKKGLFWYYLEESNITPKATPEKNNPCEKLNTPLLFEVTYFQNKINLEVYHALSDGAGCLPFLENLIYNYLKIEHKFKEDNILTKSSNYEKETDSFAKYYNPKDKKQKPWYSLAKPKRKENAYQLKGRWYPEGKIRVITGATSTQKLKDLAHQYHTTITGLLLAFTIKSFESIMSVKEKKRPITITVPIDLRKYYHSESVRNFFNVTIISYKFTKPNTPLTEIIASVDKDLKASLNESAISANMTKLIWLEKFFLIRLIPLFIKNKVMKYSYNYTRKKQTMGLSNVGIITLPKNCKPYLDKIMVMNSTDAFEICLVSYEDEICLSISSHFLNSELEKNFFRLLKSYNLDLTIYDNNIGDD